MYVRWASRPIVLQEVVHDGPGDPVQSRGVRVVKVHDVFSVSFSLDLRSGAPDLKTWNRLLLMSTSLSLIMEKVLGSCSAPIPYFEL